MSDNLRILRVEGLKTNSVHMLTDDIQVNLNYSDVRVTELLECNILVHVKQNLRCCLCSKKTTNLFWKIRLVSFLFLLVTRILLVGFLSGPKQCLVMSVEIFLVCCGLDPQRALQMALFLVRLFI